jgi:hypothetical protein
MLVNFADARERRLGEYEQLLGGSGFAVHDVLTLPSGFSILDCRASSARQPAQGTRAALEGAAREARVP